MQQSSATPQNQRCREGVAEDCCMLSLLLAVPSCIYSFWHGVIPTSYFIFNDFYTCSIIHVSPSVYTKLPSCIYSFWHGVIPTSYFIFNDFYTCSTHFFSHKYGKHTLGSLAIVIARYISRVRDRPDARAAELELRWGRGRTIAHAPYAQNGD